MVSFGTHPQMLVHALQVKVGMDFLVLFVMEDEFGILTQMLAAALME